MNILSSTSRFMQRVVNNNKSAGPSIKPHIYQQNYAHAIEPIWFDLFLQKDGQEIETCADAEQNGQSTILVGGNYTLVVVGSRQPTSSSQHGGILFHDTVNLHIQCSLNQKILIDKRCTLTYQMAMGFREEIPFEIPQEIPGCQLQLLLRQQSNHTRLKTIWDEKIAVQGTFEAEDQELLEHCQLASNLPANVAVLVIDAHPDLRQTQSFSVRGWNKRGRLPKTDYQNTIPTSIQEYIYHKKPPSDIRIAIRKFSEYVRNQSKNLTKWLSRLSKMYADDCYLIIVDDTSLEIPWEMFEFKSDYQYLGTTFKMVRWLSQSQPIEALLHVSSSQQEGSVIAYLDADFDETEIIGEKTVLQKLRPENCNSLKALHKRLKKPDSLHDIGLIYVGCHGKDGYRLYREREHGFTADQLILIDHHSHPRPVAFFNACESARIVHSGPQQNSSFVTTLLKRIVQGYIGTVAKVDMREASAIAQKVLSMALRRDNMTIAEILWVIRTEATLNLRTVYAQLDDDDPEKLAAELRFISTFIYIYYGNPLAHLNLVPGPPIVAAS